MLFADMNSLWMFLGITALIVGAVILLFAFMKPRRQVTRIDLGGGATAHNQPLPERRPLPPEELEPYGDEVDADHVATDEAPGHPRAHDDFTSVADDLVANLTSDFGSDIANDTEDSDADIEVVGFVSPVAADEERDSATDELRLALEEMQTELSHTAASRDQAQAIAAQHEQMIDSLRQQLSDHTSQNELLVTERASLAEQVAEFERRSNSLQSELDDARTQLTAATQGPTAAEYEETLRQVRAQHVEVVEELRTYLGRLEAGQASLEREKQNLATELEEARRHIDAYRDELETLRNDAPPPEDVHDDSSVQELAALRLEFDQMQGELSLAQESVRQSIMNDQQRDLAIAAAQSQQQELLDEIAELKVSLEKATGETPSDVAADLEAARAEIQSLTHNVESHRQQLAEHEASARERDEQTRQHIEQLAVEASEAAALRQQLEAARAESSAVLEQANEKINYLTHQIAFAEEQADEHEALKAKVEQLQSAMADHEELLRTKQELISQLEQSNAETDRLRSQLVDAEAHGQAVEETSAQLTELSGKFEASQAEISSLQARLSEAHEQLGAAEESARQVQGLESQREALVAELDELRNQLSDSQQQADAASESARRAQDLESELHAAVAESNRLRDQLAEAQSLVEEAEESTRQREDLEQTLRTAAAATVELRAQLEAKEAADAQRANVANQVDEERTSRIAELEAVLQQHEHQVRSWEVEKQELLDRLGASQEDVDAKAAEMRALQQQVSSLEERERASAQLQLEIERMAAEYERLSSSADDANQQVDSLQQERIELKQQLAEFTDYAEEWKSERAALRQRLGLDESENVELTDDDASTAFADQEELLAQVQRLSTALQDRDRALGELQHRFDVLQSDPSSDPESVLFDGDSPAGSSETAAEIEVLRVQRDQAAAAAAEASKTIAELSTQLSQQHEQAKEIEKLSEENREYRQSVARLQASTNALEELEIQREREQAAFEKSLREERSNLESAKERPARSKFGKRGASEGARRGKGGTPKRTRDGGSRPASG